MQTRTHLVSGHGCMSDSASFLMSAWPMPTSCSRSTVACCMRSPSGARPARTGAADRARRPIGAAGRNAMAALLPGGVRGEGEEAAGFGYGKHLRGVGSTLPTASVRDETHANTRPRPDAWGARVHPFQKHASRTRARARTRAHTATTARAARAAHAAPADQHEEHLLHHARAACVLCAVASGFPPYADVTRFLVTGSKGAAFHVPSPTRYRQCI